MPKTLEKRDGDLIIAADAGINHLEKYNLQPDIALGDFDSLGFVPKCDEIIKHPVMKNDTDTLLAVKTALARGYKRIILYGCTGKRPDHTFANYQVLSYISNKGATGFLCGDEYTTTAVTNGKLCFGRQAKGTVSVFSAVTKSTGVYLDGLLYPLNNADVTFDFPIGVSNEFIGKPSSVTVTNGTLIVMWSGDPLQVLL